MGNNNSDARPESLFLPDVLECLRPFCIRLNSRFGKRTCMDSREPFTNSGYITYLWVIGVSLWGGLVSYFEKQDEKFSVKKLSAHLLSASFAGFLTFMLCDYGHIAGPLTGVFCGVSAHLGTPALLRTRFIRKFLESEFEEDAGNKKRRK